MEIRKQKIKQINYKELIKSSAAGSRDVINAVDLGLISYNKAYGLQTRIFEKIRLTGGLGPILLLEHRPAITIGNNKNLGNLLVTEEELTSQGIELVQSNRGGDITMHTPGQVVCYMILNLDVLGKDLSIFVYRVEEVIIETLKKFGINSSRVKKHRGVFVDNCKIASVGLKVKKWITLHGFSLNVNNDLKYFDNIIPCGLKNYPQTSIKKILEKPIPIESVKDKIIESFSDVFNTPVKKTGKS
ncbi:MAG: lipoyl(octanoyl) transferase LipB [Actinomycetota bacterium]|nr:lipoyl(octanoyl) transferase LipB [Actinomycetota bacterium]